MEEGKRERRETEKKSINKGKKQKKRRINHK